MVELVTNPELDSNKRFGGFVSERARQRLVESLRDKGITSRPVLTAMSNVPRHEFVEEALKSRAYEDTALPIGYHQTSKDDHKQGPPVALEP